MEKKRLKSQALNLGYDVKNLRSKRSTGLSTFLQRKTKTILDEHWQLIQVCIQYIGWGNVWSYSEKEGQLELYAWECGSVLCFRLLKQKRLDCSNFGR